MAKSLGYKTERFQILAECGRTTFGDLFRVRDLKSDLVCSLVEIPLPQKFDTASLDYEFRMLAPLNHPMIETVIDSGPLTNSSFFYLTKWNPNNLTLNQIDERHSLDPQWIRAFTIRMIDALSFLHSNNVLHLDLNPLNIGLSDLSGDLKITIYGAGIHQILPPFLRTRSRSYSPFSIAYMSPEQLTNRQVDQTSDIYSFGVVLYEFLARKNPFKLDSFDSTLSAHLNRVPAPLELPALQEFPELESLVLQMLAKEPAFRPASFDEIAIQLNLRETPTVPPCVMSNGMFVGQVLPRKEIQTAFEEACVGNSRILIVTGSQGIGKSRFLDEMKVEMESSGSRLIDVSSSTVFDDTRDLLRNLFSEIKQYYPKIPDHLTDLIYCSASEDPLLQISDAQYLKTSHRQAANLITSAMALTDATMEDPPLVIILRNFHTEEKIPWLFLNEISEQWLSQIDLRCPVLWLIESHATILEEMQKASLHRFNSVELIPLNPDETSILLSSLLNITPIPDEVTCSIHEASRGIPQSIKLIAKSLHLLSLVSWINGSWTIDSEQFKLVPFKDGPERLFKYQQHYLEGDTKMLLQHASLWDRPFTYAELLTTMDDQTLPLRTLLQSIGSGLISRDYSSGAVYYFITHPIYRDLIHASLPAYERQRMHAVIYSLLVDSPTAPPERIAFHAFEADAGSDGCEYSTKAAQRFYMMGDYSNAAKWYQHAIERMPDRNRTKLMQLSYELAHCLIILHRFRDSLQYLEDASMIIDSRLHQKREKAHYLMMLGLAYQMQKQHQKAIETFDQAIEFLPKTTCHEIRLKIVKFAVNALNSLKRYTKTIDLVNQNIRELPIDDLPYFSGDIYYQLSIAYFEQKQFINSEASARRAIMLGEMLGNPLGYLDRYIHLGRVCQELARFREASQEFEKVIAVARLGGDLHSMAKAMALYAFLKMKQSNPDEATVLLDQAQKYARTIADPTLNIEIMNRQGQLYIFKGRLTEALEALSKALSYSEMTQQIDIQRRLQADLAMVEDLRGNTTGAVRYENLILDNARKDRDLPQIAHAYFRLANLFIRSKEWIKAQQFASRAKRMFAYLKTEFLELDIAHGEIAFARNETNLALSIASKVYAESKGMQLSRSHARANRLLAQIAAQRNAIDKAKQLYQAAIKSFESRGEWFEIGMTHVMIAEMYKHLSDLDAARVAYSEAVQFFRKVGTEYYRDKTEKAIARLNHPQDDPESSMLDKIFDGFCDMIKIASDPKKVFDRLLDICMTLTDAERAMVILLNPNGTARLHLSRNVEQKVIRDVTWIINQISKSAPMFGEGCLIGNAPTDPRVSNLKSVQEGLIFSVLCLPIIHDSSVVGALYLDSKRSFDIFSPTHSSLMNHLLHIVFALLEQQGSTERVPQEMAAKRETNQIAAFDQFIGDSRLRNELITRVRVFSNADSVVLISGGIGTGKDKIALAIHENSSRRSMPFKQLNCASIPDSLVDSEIFGCTSGTEYRIDKTGLLESCEGGTLYLKDIESTSRTTQLMIARCIESSEFSKLGSTETKTCNIRFILSSTRDLRADVQVGAFNDELYRLIARFHLKSPQLVDYRDDIPLLSKVALENAGKLLQKRFTGFEPKAIEALIQYSWPRNIDELNETIRNAAIAASPPVIEFKDLPHSIRVTFAKSGATVGMPELRSMDEVEEAHIRAILIATGGNKLRACDVLQVSRPTLDRKLERYNINVKKSKRDSD